MSRPFVPTESYMHDAAKRVVAQWFRETADALGQVSIGQVYSRPNRFTAMRGVYLEYPIGTDGEGVVEVWDEDLRLHPSLSESDLRMPHEVVPTIEMLSGLNVRTKCICDVALLHKGRLGTVIEVVYKHPTPLWKRKFLQSLEVDLVEVDAFSVLNCTKRPESLPFYRAKVSA